MMVALTSNDGLFCIAFIVYLSFNFACLRVFLVKFQLKRKEKEVEEELWPTHLRLGDMTE